MFTAPRVVELLYDPDSAAQCTMIPTQHTVNTPYMVGPVHFYTIELGGELVMFDTGPPTEEGTAYLQDHVDLKRLKHVIVTHCHIDHYGQSSWLCDNSDATIYFPYRDTLKIRYHEKRLQEMYELLSDLGFDQDYLLRLRESFNRGTVFPPVPEDYLVAEHDLPARLGIRVLCCAGHSQSDLVYSCNNWAVTGDTLLRGIYQSPLLDVDLENGGRFNNYLAYCQTLHNLARLKDKKILPGHRRTIESVDATIQTHIAKTLYRTTVLKPDISLYSVAEIIDRVFGKELSDPFHVYLKASEIVFMMDLLKSPDLLQKTLQQIGLFEKMKDSFARATASSS